MRALRLVPMFVLSLVLSGGQTILMVNQADARPCNPYKKEPPPPCTSGWFLVIGSGEWLHKKGDIFLIKNIEGYYLTVKASKEVVKAFKGEKTRVDHGVFVLSKPNGKEITLTAFIRNENGQEMQDLSALEAYYNSKFQEAEAAQKPTSHYEK